uniref:Nudix hydrolase domain-containing protein n=1 Tax=Ditylenchus dipsaci TaxID=166011 RepID=A0A915E0B8_9BILA
MLNFSYKVRGRCLIVSHHEKETPRKRTFGSLESVDDKRIKTTDMNSSVTKSDHLVDVSFGEIPQQSLYIQPMRMHFTRKIPEQNESVKTLLGYGP